MKLRATDAHLTYCTNIHAAESLADVQDRIEHYTVRIKRNIAPDRPFGVGLRLSARAAEELDAPRQLQAFRDFLRTHGLYVFTINGFPYGPFHAEPIKERVYLPDWLDEARLAYTERLAALLARLLPPDPALEGSISTVPGAFRRRIRGQGDIEEIAGRLLHAAATLLRIHRTTGRTITLALEPEPACMLETTNEAIAFFEERLLCRAALSRFAALTSESMRGAEAAVRRHLSICLDACHLAVGFEDPPNAVASLSRAGIRIGKIQLGAALELPPEVPLGDGLRALRAFADPVYLHQASQKLNRGLVRYPDLPQAIEAIERVGRLQGPLRVHFHVPVVYDALGLLSTTHADLRVLLARLAEQMASAHLEVETYTWAMMPQEHRGESVVEMVSRELCRVQETLER